MRAKPSDRPILTRYASHAREGVEVRLRRTARTWNWLAVRAEEAGLGTRATIQHWGAGRNAQIGVGLYLGLCDILREEEDRCPDCR
jgi:hypothetical protein